MCQGHADDRRTWKQENSEIHCGMEETGETVPLRLWETFRVSQAVPAAVTRYHRLSNMNNTDEFLTLGG